MAKASTQYVREPPPDEPSVIEGSVRSMLPGSQRAGGSVITRIGGSGSMSKTGHEFGRDICQREWTHHNQPVEERDDEGDIIPDGVFSFSDDDEFDNTREELIADEYD